jgi:hypothetical protein
MRRARPRRAQARRGEPRRDRCRGHARGRWRRGRPHQGDVRARAGARTLADDAAHEAEKLADASPQRGVERQRDEAVAIAIRIEDALGQIAVFPGGERAAAAARDDLRAIGREIDHLSERLKDVP